MKNSFKISLIVLAQVLFLCAVQAQFGIKKPKIKVDKPNINIGKENSSSNNSSGGSVVPKADPSGLFQKVSDDPSAKHHRSNCVEKLEALEAAYAKEIVSYAEIEELMNAIEKSLASAHKLEPAMSSDKFDVRYAESKQLVVADLDIIKKMKQIEKTISNDYSASAKYQSPAPLQYRLPKGYNAVGPCYCREWDKTWTHADYTELVAEYSELGNQVPKYRNEKTEKDLSDLETCMANGNKYASTDAVEKTINAIKSFEEQERALKPKSVIEKCEDYLQALTMIKSDPSLNFDAVAIAALDNAKVEVENIKTSAELYISSGEFKRHLVQVEVDRAKKVFMPTAAEQNANFETQAKTYIKGAEYAAYLKKIGENAVASSLRAVSVINGYYVKKNEIDIPKYKHKEIVVAYKDTEGVCHQASVYVTYTYEGGGVYAKTPIWGADAPIQMACENVNK